MGEADIGLVGLAVMGQNLALNVAEKGFKIAVYNRSGDKTDSAVARAQKEGLGDNLQGFKDLESFVRALKKPAAVIILVKAGAPVDATLEGLAKVMEPGDLLIDGGNEWYENTERRAAALAQQNSLLYLGMGVSGGEEGARKGPSMMPGGSLEAYKRVEPILCKVAAQVEGPCVTYVGDGGAGNFVKMVHNGIEYGDMQLIAEAYDLLKIVGGFSNDEIAETFQQWNNEELESFLMEISAIILAKRDDRPATEKGAEASLVDLIVDRTGMKGTGKWTLQQAAELSVAAPTIAAALDGRFLSGLKDQREGAAKFYAERGLGEPRAVEGIDKEQFKADVKAALYASKICSYAQGMNIIRAKSEEKGWDIEMGEMARIWKGGCIIRAAFLDDIRQAYVRDPDLKNLLLDPMFAEAIVRSQESWRRVVAQAIQSGISVSGISSSLGYFDAYRRERLPANLVQAQRDFFGSHTYERLDREGWFHTLWSDSQSADSITTSGYNN